MIRDDRIAVLSDIHGEHRILKRALERCGMAEVRRVILLGDLFDRCDQVENCLRPFAGWSISGVLGNHEREALQSEFQDNPRLEGRVGLLVSQFGDRLLLGNALFVHDLLEWKNDPEQSTWTPHVVFAGHTHVRQARDQHGPLDLSLGQIRLRWDRDYLINPGAVADGQFAIWDRKASTVNFQRV
jgi:predicted phosphodiesterase